VLQVTVRWSICSCFCRNETYVQLILRAWGCGCPCTSHGPQSVTKGGPFLQIHYFVGGEIDWQVDLDVVTDVRGESESVVISRMDGPGVRVESHRWGYW